MTDHKRSSLVLCTGTLALSFPAPAAPDLGIKLEGITDYAAVLPFADAIKSARKFGSPDRPWGQNAPTGADGWPTDDAGLVVFASQRNIAGDYQLAFTGKARATVTGGSEIRAMQPVVLRSTPRRLVRARGRPDVSLLVFFPPLEVGLLGPGRGTPRRPGPLPETPRRPALPRSALITVPPGVEGQQPRLERAWRSGDPRDRWEELPRSR